MTTEGQDYTIYQGNDIEIEVQIMEEGAAPKDITGAAITWALYDPILGTIVLQKSTGNGITIMDATAGQFTIALSNSETGALAPGGYGHEAEIQDSQGNIATVFTGVVTVKRARI